MTAAPIHPEPALPVRNLVPALDLIERVVVASLFAFFVYRMVASFLATGLVINLVLVVSESLVVIFVLIRRPARTMSLNPVDWILAFVATAAPLFAQPDEVAPLVPPILCVILTLCGLALQVAAKLTLRRNFGIVAANRGITTGGPYNFVRHPMYIAYMMTWVAFLLTNPTLWNSAVYAIAFAFQIARLLAEERLLTDDDIYREFRERVRWRLVPRVF
ncbi:MAG TPA: methyltransferase [Bauldia sp.]|nr:methyltransferase [Bauldia sp.]